MTREAPPGEGVGPVVEQHERGAPPPPWVEDEPPAAPRVNIRQACEITGLSTASIQRRVDAWLAGEEKDRATGYALKGGRAGRNRTVDLVDARRLARQLAGDEVIRSGSQSPGDDDAA
jgi:hypothetical protein